MNQAIIQSVIERANRRKIAATDALFKGRKRLEQLNKKYEDQSQTNRAIKIIDSANFHANAALKNRKDTRYRKNVSQTRARIIWKDPYRLTRSSELRDVWDDVLGSTVTSLATSILAEVMELAKAPRSKWKEDTQAAVRKAFKNISQTTARSTGTSLLKSLIKHRLRMVSPKLGKGPFSSLASTLIVDSIKDLSQLAEGRISDPKIYRCLAVRGVRVVASWTGAEAMAAISAPLGPAGMFLGGLLGGKLGEMGSVFVLLAISQNNRDLEILRHVFAPQLLPYRV